MARTATGWQVLETTVSLASGRTDMSTPAPRSTAHRVKLAALAVGLAVALVLAEGIARFAERHAAVTAEDDVRRLSGHVLPELGPTRGEIRLLIVGDSFTDGAGLRPGEPYPYRLTAIFDERFGADAVEVITLASSGLNTVKEYRTAKPYILELTPDLVLLAICLNDPESSDAEQRREFLRAAGWRDPNRLRDRLPYRASAFARLVIDDYQAWRSRRSLVRYYMSWYNEELPSWRAFVRALKRFRRIVKETGAGLVLVVFPIFDSPLDERYPYRDLHARLADLGRELEVPLLDLLPAYAGMDVRELAVVPFTDPHPNALAHRIAAARIAEFLAAGRFLEAASPLAESPGAASYDE